MKYTQFENKKLCACISVTGKQNTRPRNKLLFYMAVCYESFTSIVQAPIGITARKLPNLLMTTSICHDLIAHISLLMVPYMGEYTPCIKPGLEPKEELGGIVSLNCITALSWVHSEGQIAISISFSLIHINLLSCPVLSCLSCLVCLSCLCLSVCPSVKIYHHNQKKYRDTCMSAFLYLKCIWESKITLLLFVV